MGRFWTIIVLILFIEFSCKSYYENEAGSYRPKNPKFKLAKKPYQLKDDDLIDYNSVYVKTGIVYYGDEARREEFFIRFFSNGRCYFGSHAVFKTKLTIQDINNLNDGGIGYYKIVGNNLLMEEFRVGGQFGTTPYYNEYSTILKQDTIFFCSKEIDKPNNQNCSYYVRKKVEGLKGTPDW